MRDRISAVYDFDGTWTDAIAEVQPALEQMKEFLALNLGLSSNEFELLWELHWNKLHRSQDTHGDVQNVSGHGRVITSPLASSIYKLYVEILISLLTQLTREKLYDSKSPIFFASKLIHIERGLNTRPHRARSRVHVLAETLMTRFLRKRSPSEEVCFRPELEDHLAFALDRGFDLALITNSPEEVVRRKIASRDKLAALVWRMERGGRRVHGGAAKYSVDSGWNGQVRGEQFFRGVPEKVRLTNHGLRRPVYMRRRTYFDALSRSDFFAATRRFAIGDSVENDLLLPHMFRAQAALVPNNNTPDHEFNWASNTSGARVAANLEQVSEMMESV